MSHNIKVCWTVPPSLCQTTHNNLSIETAQSLAAEMQSQGCLVNIYGLPKPPEPPTPRVRQGNKGESPKCTLCGTKAANDNEHPIVDCLTIQLTQTKNENANLRQSVINWKQAWYQCRDIIGKLAWEKK